MDRESKSRVLKILAGLPRGARDIEQLTEPEAKALNESIMARCCHRERLVTSFVDALRDPHLMFADAQGWKKLATFIPEVERQGTVYLAADLYGMFRLPADRVAELLASDVWTHEVFVVGATVEWLVGINHENVFLQGEATVALMTEVR